MTRFGAPEHLGIKPFAFRDLSRQMMSDGAVRRLHASQVSGDVRSHNEAGELAGQKIERDQRNSHQQKHRDHADENISNDQPVAEAPQQLRTQPPEASDSQQHNRQHAEKTDPASKACRHCRTHASHQPLQRKQKQVQRERVKRGPRDPTLRPQTVVAQLALEFQRDQSHRIT